MTDPLAEIVGLLKPGAPFSKCVTGSGPWQVRRTQLPNPYYLAVLKGRVRYCDKQGRETLLETGDFILIPSAEEFVLLSEAPSTAAHTVRTPVILPGQGYRVGSIEGPIDMRAMVGYCVFQSDNAALLRSLLPELVVVKGEHRLSMLMELLGEEAIGSKPGREVVLRHLLEVLLIEALRSTAQVAETSGLVRGLSDTRLATTLRAMHGAPERPWTVATLAREAGMSRSSFHDRFQSALGVAPMEYLQTWRLALAKDMLRKREASAAEIARKIGYSSASAFSVAFTRDVGMTPLRYARHSAEDAAEVEGPALSGAIA